jgi:hypothetical protein
MRQSAISKIHLLAICLCVKSSRHCGWPWSDAGLACLLLVHCADILSRSTAHAAITVFVLGLSCLICNQFFHTIGVLGSSRLCVGDVFCHPILHDCIWVRAGIAPVPIKTALEEENMRKRRTEGRGDCESGRWASNSQ